MIKKYNIPEIITQTGKALTNEGFDAYLVGGCVRDLLSGNKPKDWDITTNAKPEQIQKIFSKTVYENKYGTVAVINEDVDDSSLRAIEITPYRLESKYSDKRHPDKVSFTCNLEEDLKRRDFTINAMAINMAKGVSRETIDFFGGKKDLKNKVIKAVGNPEDRFNEDALRILRAIRLSTELGFTIDDETENAIKNCSHLLEIIAKERVREEFVKIVMSQKPSAGIEQMRKFGVLKHISPELEQGYGVGQNKAHKFNVWEHNLFSLEHAALKNWPLEIRLSALFHDVGKPASRRWNKEKGDWTFYNHEVIGAKMTAKILSRLKFPKKTIDLVAKLVRYHLFFSDTEKITLSAVRRTVRNVGPENVWDLMKVRFCDRIGMGRPKETPYRLRKYESMIEEAMRSPLAVSMLKIDGSRVMALLKIPPGPKIGNILHILLEEAIDVPENNTKEWLENRVLELGKLNDKELEKLGKMAKESKVGKEQAEINEIRKRWWVK
ncbi:CCA tRNA nucleotidyltransferase [Patescibacteria group bacterium]|nr:CCA tRNA nucleotidyltransferase [Patescibacteria group bacterium]MBU4353101.1 CCA tRNA nucleotidyltransferase [Patescibacteria group bacterium]MBU4477401.1 CCA tRNA nucleotidyltransferase [Patescibacteria group bacterium]MCG2698881.1 CCA tRNA nucleotidyltransferase [Candidatus Parcubacteria bacterium]